MSVTVDQEPTLKDDSRWTKTFGGKVLLVFVCAVLLAATAGFVASIFVNQSAATDRDSVTKKLATISAEITDLVQNNDIPTDSQIAGTVQYAPTKGQIISSDTNKTYLFSLPPFTRGGLIYDPPYIEVSGTVGGYTITYSNEGRNLTAVYDSKTDSVSFSEYQKK